MKTNIMLTTRQAMRMAAFLTLVRVMDEEEIETAFEGVSCLDDVAEIFNRKVAALGDEEDAGDYVSYVEFIPQKGEEEPRFNVCLAPLDPEERKELVLAALRFAAK